MEIAQYLAQDTDNALIGRSKEEKAAVAALITRVGETCGVDAQMEAFARDLNDSLVDKVRG